MKHHSETDETELLRDFTFEPIAPRFPSRCFIRLASETNPLGHDVDMARLHVRTTIDRWWLERSKSAGTKALDAQGIDHAYEVAYRRQPLDTPDEWGDLASFRHACGLASSE
jgi:hypothetical protein